MGWIVGAVCLMIAGFAVLPAPAQDPKGARPDAREVRTDKAEGGKKKELDASRERLRAAYRSGDPAAIKAARESYQKLRSEAKERNGSAPQTR
jgi:hypothetical protein